MAEAVKRLLFLTTSTSRGGAEKMLYEVISRLDRQRYEPFVVSLNSPGEYADHLTAVGIPVRSIHMRGSPTLDQLRRVSAWIREFQPDLIHAFLFKAVQVARMVAWSTPILSSPRINYRSFPVWARTFDRLMRFRDVATLAESKATAQYLITRMDYPADRVHVVTNGIDLQRWSHDCQGGSQVRGELGVGSDPLIVAVGRLVEQKGFVYLLRALSGLEKGARWQAVIAGDGPLRTALAAEIVALGLDDRVRLLGERRDIISLLSAADLFVLPSLWEGMPNAVLEAAACGCPIVATDVDGTPEILQHGEQGLLVEPGSVDSLAAAIRRLLFDQMAARMLGKAARRRVEEAFDLTTTVQQYESVYEKSMKAWETRRWSRFTLRG